MFFRNTRRFTLMEMMIVVFVIAILVGIATVSATSLLGTSKGTAINADARTLEAAILQFQVNDPNYLLPIVNEEEPEVVPAGQVGDIRTIIKLAIKEQTGVTPNDVFIDEFMTEAFFAISPSVNKYIKSKSKLNEDFYIIGDSLDLAATIDGLAENQNNVYKDELAGMLISKATVTDSDGYMYNGQFKFKK